MQRLTSWICLAATGLALPALTGCRGDIRESDRKLEFDAFVPLYNRYIANWILEQKAATMEDAARLAKELESATDETRPLIESQMSINQIDQEKWEFRQSLGDFIKIGNPSEIPADLVWEDGMDQPEIGDPAATKGGVFRRYIPTFPPTIRPFGDNSNNSFRGDLYDYIDLPLVALHPETMEMIPGLAREWATSGDGRTIYFRVDPEATYSDGVPVLARDFLVNVFLRVSDNIVNPYAKQYYRENVAQFAMYDDRTLSVSLPEAKVYAPAIAGAMTPAPPHFYDEYGPDYTERYQWKFPPTTGAYEVRDEDIVKGVSITQSRVGNWWAKDRKYYKHRFNPDKIVHVVVRDEAKAFELFRAGEHDTFLLTRPEFWYEKSEMPPVYDGYIERVTFYNRYPKLPRGLYMNVTRKPLDDRNVRIGICHAMHWQKVIDVMFRGDYQRLNAFNEGYDLFSDPTIRARPYSIQAARAAFREAGYTTEGRDGILRKSDGTRLSAAVTYPSMQIFDRMFAILREEAKNCGFDLRLDGQEATVTYKKNMQKQHELTLASWFINPPVPDYHQFLHSSNALDEKGNPKPQTNNLFVWARADTDRLSEQVRTARTPEELAVAAKQLQRIMHDEAIFDPGYTVDFVRVGSWRWVRWPDSENTRFSPPVIFDPHEVFVFWIDEKIKAETQSARRSGRVFEESSRIVDVYRPGVAAPPADEETPEPTPEPAPLQESEPEEGEP